MSEERELDIYDDGMSGDRAQNIKGTAKRFFRDLMKQRGRMLIVTVCIVAAAVFNILTPTLIGQAINQIYDGVKHASATGEAFQVNGTAMAGILSAIALLYLFGMLFSFIEQYVMAGISQKLTLSLRKSISGKLNRLPLRYYDSHKKGEILSRVTSDLEKVADTLQEGLSQMITAVVTIIGAFVMMMFISPSLTAIAFGTIIASVVVAALISTKTNRCYAANQAALGELNANIEEAFTGNAIIKAFNLQDEMIETNGALNEKLQKASAKAQFITYAINPLVRFLGQTGYVIIAVRGAMSVIRGSITIGEIQAIFQYLNQVSEPVTQFAYTMNSLQAAIASAERVYQIQDELEEIPDTTEQRLLTSTKGNVTFEHVRFGYQDDRILMEDINIHVPAGSKVAIVGPTGAGKTTLVNLLMRFYELQGGKITIDGVNINDMSRRELRSILGMVLQDTWLFNGSVAENIAYGRTGAGDQDIRRAAKAARIDHFIRTLPQGYQTVIDDELLGMSVGQKQLLTIARAILADPAILILDEATSSVDTRTEIEIQKAMENLMKGRTSFVIAHRLSTIRDADMILVMREGNIVEHGTHEGLLEKNGFYADLYDSQFAVKAS